MRLYGSILLLILINVTIPDNGYAQNKFSYGLVGGVGYNFTTLEKASPIGFSLGWRIEKKLKEKMNLRTGVVLLQTGSRESPGGCLFCGGCYCPIYAEFDFTFISIPLNLKYYLSGNEKRQYYVSFGLIPYFASISVQRGGNPEPEEWERKPVLGEPKLNGYLYQRLLNLNLSPGVEFTINEKMMLQAELEIRYAMMELSSGGDDMFSAMATISILFKSHDYFINADLK